MAQPDKLGLEEGNLAVPDAGRQILRWSSPPWGHPLPRPAPVPEPAAVSQEHVQVALQGVLVEGTAQPGAAAAHIRGDVAQGVEAL